MAPRVEDYEETGADAPSGGPRRIRAAQEPRHWAGCEPQTIPAGGEVTFVFSLNVDMNPDQLVIPTAFASQVAVVGATVGPISIHAGDGPMPGEAFTADSNVRFLPAVPITQGQPLRVRIRNVGSSSPIVGVYLGIVGKIRRAAA